MEALPQEYSDTFSPMPGKAAERCPIVGEQIAPLSIPLPARAREEHCQDGVRPPTHGGGWTVLYVDRSRLVKGAPLCRDFGPDALARKHFQQDGMGHPAVDDMGFADTLFECVQTGVHLGEHALGNRPLLDHTLDILA
jgi:hypothetical protein